MGVILKFLFLSYMCQHFVCSLYLLVCTVVSNLHQKTFVSGGILIKVNIFFVCVCVQLSTSLCSRNLMKYCILLIDISGKSLSYNNGFCMNIVHKPMFLAQFIVCKHYCKSSHNDILQQYVAVPLFFFFFNLFLNGRCEWEKYFLKEIYSITVLLQSTFQNISLFICLAE